VGVQTVHRAHALPDDETMLKMMAADNDDAYNLTPAFILETVEVAREFVAKSYSGNVTRIKGPTGAASLAPQIAAFLAWPQERVKHALAQLAAFEPDEETKEPTLSREAVKQLPTLWKSRGNLYAAK
jgi:hypothetical protein